MNRYKIYDEAEKLIEAGWIKGAARYDTPEGTSYCLYGALKQAVRNEHGYMNVPEEIIIEVGKKIPGEGEYGYKITKWNDSSLTTKEDVIKLLQKLKRRHILRKYI